MVLCPLGDPSPSPEQSSRPTPAWEAVEAKQKQQSKEWLLITQPDHAELAGDLAARLQSPLFPELQSNIVHAIALHDAGWARFDGNHASTPDAFTPKLNDRAKPLSFLEVSPGDFVIAWTASIDKAETTGPAGGVIVSRHFCRLAEGRLDSRIDNEEDTARLRHFLHQETQRQQRLISRDKYTNAQLDFLTDVLQFCDLLSLYLCAGSKAAVEFPQDFRGKRISVRAMDEMFQFEPKIFGAGVSLGVSARVYPPQAELRSLAFLLS